LKIALLGYGKMGKVIESTAIKRGHTIVSIIDSIKVGEIKSADIAIDFSTPNSAFQNIEKALKNKVSVVSGTTGWLKDLNKLEKLAIKENVGFIYSSNFSLGVNLFFQLNKSLSKLMTSHNYSVELSEKHHAKKVDSPSGTSISLANEIILNSKYEKWKLDSGNKELLNIKSSRTGHFPGIHNVSYKSEFDKISIEHESYSRAGYAIGAVIAAEWLCGKNGVFSMSDVLNIK
jgi:4-hydroxy-tetrahydrodipicolinate reductase